MNYKEIIESKYNRESWQQLLHDIFLNKVTFHNSPGKVHVSSHLAKEALNLGYIKLSDGLTIAIYEVELSDNVDIERNRRGIRDMLTTDWRTNHAGAFMFCYRKNESILRFSYVSETWGFNKQGEYEKISTDTKRYTYLLGEGRGCHTAIKQFGKLKESKQALTDITEAFSVETLTKQFYKDLFEWYQWAIDDSTQVTFPNNITTEDDDRDDVEKKVIRMITRIMFVWFIKQKELVPNRIFDIEYLSTILKEFDPYSTTVGNYYNAILQNLFFATLNCAIEDENGNTRKFATSTKRDVKTSYRYAEMFSISEQEIVNLFSEAPFLNGGLFECLDKTRYIDGVEQCYNFDGFSRNDAHFADGRYKHRAVVPNILFFEPEKGLLSILSRYNFTIEENSPEEQQVALDPELLGKVFENLLGAYNPETKETARNQSGSFYTPREIVNYMVDESLIAYLGNNDFVRSLFSYDFTFDKAKSNEYLKIADKLKAVKILDPACGSGAFPMGLLNRMIDILERISPNEDIYELKLSVIENCLYGCDIQSIAAQITKLRFFISLICNCEKDASKPNFGIPTLPNLETNFVSANSLIAKKKKPTQGNLFENPEIEPTRNELAEIRHKHFSAKSASTKHRLREKDQILREKLARLLSDDDNFVPEDAKQLASWNPYDQNAVSPFFDPEWMFGVADGFDIVIGNPPYLRIQGIRNSNSDFADYLVANYNSATGSFDLYVAFVERALQLISSNGIVNFIMPVKWTNAAFGKGLRDVVSKQKAAKKIINFSEYQVFNASTYTGLQWFKPNSDCLEYYELDRNLESNIELKSYLENLSKDTSSIVNTDKLNKDTWVLASSEVSKLLNKLNEQPLRLEDVFEKIFQGIATSKDDVYFLYDCTETQSTITGESKQLNKRVTIEKGLVKPLLKGEDVHRYDNLSSNRYVIFPYKLENGTANLYAEEELKLLFPNGYAYLKECETLLRGREKGRLKNDIYWYRYIYPKNLTLFQSPKLVAPEISLGGNFSYDGNGQFYSTTKIYGYILKSSMIQYGYNFFLGLLNSSLFWFFIQNTGYVLRGGYFTFKTNYVSPFPIPKFADIDSTLLLKIDNNVESIMELNAMKGNDTQIKLLIKEIDSVIYKIYNLSSNEIQLIDSQSQY